jgi:hypothetical protein
LGGAAAPALPERIAPFVSQELALPFFRVFLYSVVNVFAFSAFFCGKNISA